MKKGFTLIELLVVIAIIGVLASVVLASLNTARGKGTEAAIKANLKNMIPQAELAYDTAGNYSTACANITGMLNAITNAGGTPACYTYDSSRWGVSVKLNSDATKNWAVDGSGVVTWNTTDAAVSTWDVANTNCAAIGGRLPSIEQLKALYNTYGATPSGFISGVYWSGTTYVPDSTGAYIVDMGSGVVSFSYKTGTRNVRCVR